MADIVAGVGATISTDKLEKFTVGLIEFGQRYENETGTNTTGANFITSSSTPDNQGYTDGRAETLTARIAVPITLAALATKLELTAPDYLSGMGGFYTSGTGGTFDSEIWLQDLVSALTRQHLLEIQASRQPFIRIRIESQTALINTVNSYIWTADVTLPLISTFGANGAKSSEGMVYL